MIARLRALLAGACVVVAVPLLGATSPLGAPVVVVYPITSTGTIASATGGNLALLIASKLTELGGIAVKAPTPGTARAQFLDAAVTAGADYYVSGFLTPIGVDSSLVTQVVSTQSGSVIFSTTTVVKTYADALAQVDVLRAAIVRHAGRGLAALDAPPPAPAPSNAAVNNGAVDIGRALRKKKRLATEAPGPTPARADLKPTRLLFALSGNLDPALVSFATRAILDGFARAKSPVALLGVQLGDNIARADSICAGNPGTRELDTATAMLGGDDVGGTRIQLDLVAYDCAGKLLRSSRATANVRGSNGLQDALEKTAADATRDLTMHER